MKHDKFVLSKTHFSTIIDAEKKVQNWHDNGSLNSNKVKLYKTIEVYDLKLRFIKRKKIK